MRRGGFLGDKPAFDRLLFGDSTQASPSTTAWQASA